MLHAFVTSVALPPRTGRAPIVCRRNAVVRASQEPPESRISPSYPPKTRFQAPTLKFHDVPGCELMNKIGLVMEEVALDEPYAASLLESFRATYVKESGDFANLFVRDARDTGASDSVERYFPKSRRNEVPIIELVGGADAPESVTISVGKVIAESEPDDTEEAVEVAKRVGEFWKRGSAGSAEEIVIRNYGTVNRNLAPVIEVLDGQLALSMKMQNIHGAPDKGDFEDRYMLAPKIRIKKPVGDWDESAFIEVSCEEVQLPFLKTV